MRKVEIAAEKERAGRSLQLDKSLQYSVKSENPEKPMSPKRIAQQDLMDYFALQMSLADFSNEGRFKFEHVGGKKKRRKKIGDARGPWKYPSLFEARKHQMDWKVVRGHAKLRAPIRHFDCHGYGLGFHILFLKRMAQAFTLATFIMALPIYIYGSGDGFGKAYLQSSLMSRFTVGNIGFNKLPLDHFNYSLCYHQSGNGSGALQENVFSGSTMTPNDDTPQDSPSPVDDNARDARREK